MPSIVRLIFIGLTSLSVVFGCDTPPDHWDVSHPRVEKNHDEEPDTVEDFETETTEEFETDTDVETEMETDTGPLLDTETEKPTNPPKKKSCRESVTCLFQNSSNPTSCLTQADAEAQKLLLDVITCLTTKGCLKDLQNIQNLITCAMRECSAEFMACMSDS